MKEIKELEISGLKLINLHQHNDSRGWFRESWRDSWVPEINFVQDMWSYNENIYTLRGLHTIKNPQHKLVSVLNGVIFDVVVDLRPESLTYKKHCINYMMSNTPSLLLIPPGCFHGYLTLTMNTLVGYKVDQYHNNDLDTGINYADEELNIPWPLHNINPIISERDKKLPFVKDL